MRINFLVGALAASIACATTGTTAAGVRHDSNLITEQEVTASNAANAYEVISRVRPTFLRSRGRTSVNLATSDYPTVYVNGQQYGDISSLRNIVASQIREIRYYSASDAATKYGTQGSSGAIEITMK